ncbi:hypothetical protein PENTCL1PPCAC_19071, partial [Pristionchus entomophagus]
ATMLRLAVLVFLVCTRGAALDGKPDCSKVCEGVYGKGCSSEFYLCRNTILYTMHCHSGLYFDPLTKACNFKEKVRICADRRY